ncbi:uncharacterized protein CELE_ZC262.4 [Caenorhabditis elegans]|uniref:Uncharacterized protein ZC262.4 n=1 Tax=Caenorhabditis elegans TaxID=6239 RepID=YOD4_CAEEL|nr:Uncharacterized protein CELE_ZC262.4 [Caenorhabditis elegans]P34596.3 RecName: Full=Uncharacterized protein ZC262.4 [Caenorhabditis elegans]CCD69196.1 Uncharacterized protein CELE_ZC262.4 [Caenorhabditis elegans]|eukprot:NP_498837.2 Uncharacterized protein CELE_ZC262.4 [Caenorhabditis elegans]
MNADKFVETTISDFMRLNSSRDFEYFVSIAKQLYSRGCRDYYTEAFLTHLKTIFPITEENAEKWLKYGEMLGTVGEKDFRTDIFEQMMKDFVDSNKLSQIAAKFHGFVESVDDWNLLAECLFSRVRALEHKINLTASAPMATDPSESSC